MSVAPSARPFDPVHMEPFKVQHYSTPFTPPPPKSAHHHVKPRTKKTRLTMPNSNLPTPAPQRGILALASPPACSSSCARPSCPSSSSSSPSSVRSPKLGSTASPACFGTFAAKSPPTSSAEWATGWLSCTGSPTASRCCVPPSIGLPNLACRRLALVCAGVLYI